MWGNDLPVPPSIEDIRKKSKILVIDDHDFPYEPIFKKNGYHIERWATIDNLSHITDGHFDLILLDIQGVGIEISPELEGLGILRHIKESNPAQMVILYSAQPQRITHLGIMVLADAVVDKALPYVDFASKVDSLLKLRSSPAYFIAAMNKALGENAVLAPKAVGKAMKALQKRNVSGFARYMDRTPLEPSQVNTVVGILQLGVAVASMVITA
ncbi:hypothetical protein P4U43_06680 [Arthrobacter sp. EH-1B-1]|uniref:Response regulator receiver domain-containing protein n=1 Tax=Arthrobacter vasquezii TaxID=2977629 RepID=A0ABT6CTT4_9MICC|nr:hypothetical protein [Arthrobacter vasquezii]MDF9277477.1 hypothetical protein [Arthrobacter vasquezii]